VAFKVIVLTEEMSVDLKYAAVDVWEDFAEG
jgi:hypothetical protein